MSVTPATPLKERTDFVRRNSGLLTSPAAVLFVSANLANAANLVFNMIFARLLGPALFADLALLLTIKLSVVSVLGAAQTAMAKRTARATDLSANVGKDTFALAIKSVPASIIVMFVAMATIQFVGGALLSAETLSLLILSLSIPFLLPMMFFRGLAQGRVDIPPLVASYQFEWIVRLVGGLLLWWAGLGLAGIAVALFASLMVGLLASIKPSDVHKAGSVAREGPQPKLLEVVAASVPFMALQLAQTTIIDGDIVVSSAWMENEQAGLVAGLVLIQRIFFFGFMSFSMLLLPAVTMKVAQMDWVGARREFKKSLMLLISVAVVALAIVAAVPAVVADVVLGNQYKAVVPLVLANAVIGFAFTVTHLSVTYFIAVGQKYAASTLVALAGLQFLILNCVMLISDNQNPFTMFASKVVFQVLLALVACTIAFRRNRMAAAQYEGQTG